MEHALNRALSDPDWGAACQMRSQLYGWFSTVFAREMEPDAMALCLQGGAEHLLAVFKALGLGRQADAVAAVFKAWAGHSDAPLENAADFAALFLLEGGGAPIPYASHYLEGGGQLYGESARVMRAFLVSSQLQLDAQFKEPEDHIAYLCEVMRYLIAGDCVYLYENWAGDDQVEHIAIGLYTDLVVYDESLRKIETMDCEVIHSHDFAVVRRHRFG